jgi:hypothetical protein
MGFEGYITACANAKEVKPKKQSEVDTEKKATLLRKSRIGLSESAICVSPRKLSTRKSVA